MLVLMSRAEDETIRILVNEIEYRGRVKTTDVMFARFVDIFPIQNKADKEEFHKLMIKLGKLGERRNDIVHSRYVRWKNIDGDDGLIRYNS
jgi:hypothetical protein